MGGRLGGGSFDKWESAETVQLLQSRGFDAARLTSGYPDWSAAGLPTENGHPASSTTGAKR